MALNKVELQDENRNIYYFHTSADITFCEDGETVENKISNLDKVAITKEQVLDMFFPVGSIYTSVNKTDPGTTMGGTWVEFAKGRTLVGVDTSQIEFDTVEKTGGDKKHTLTVDEIPSHKHPWKGYSAGNLYTGSGSGVDYALFGSDVWSRDANKGIQDAGGGQPHNNLQPYITVYIWKRIK